MAQEQGREKGLKAISDYIASENPDKKIKSEQTAKFFQVQTI
jgi:hypothetical protein